MCDQCNTTMATFACDPCGDEAAILPGRATSRRAFLKQSALAVAALGSANVIAASLNSTKEGPTKPIPWYRRA